MNNNTVTGLQPSRIPYYPTFALVFPRYLFGSRACKTKLL